MDFTSLPHTRSRQYDVGVLLVHGIGQQRRGETLVEAGGALVEALQDYLDVLKPESGRRPAVETGSVRLQRHEDRGPESDHSPAWAEIALKHLTGWRRSDSPFRGQSESRWLMAESWWAEAFPAVSHGAVMRWILHVLPLVVISHFDRRLRRASFVLWNRDIAGTRLMLSLRFLFELVQLLFAVALVPVALFLLAMFALLGVFPVHVVEPISRWVQQTLASIVGDSYVLLAKPLARGAILETVRRDAAWLAERCERIVIVAHSQGGAIAHEVVRAHPMLQCDVLLTYGSGLHKLALVERLLGKKTAPWVWGAILGIFAAVLGVGHYAAGLSIVSDATALRLAAVGALIGLISLRRWFAVADLSFKSAAQATFDQALFNTRFRLPNERTIWRDVFASEDPVPNGPLLDEYHPREFSSHRTWNFGSRWRDHTGYWQNLDDFVARLTRLLLSQADVDLEQLDSAHGLRRDVATQRRRWRVRWRRWAFLALLIAGSTFATLVLVAPPAWAIAALRQFTFAVHKIPAVGGLLPENSGETFASGHGLLFIVLVSVLLLRLLLALWNWWEVQERRLAIASEGFRLCPPRFALYATALVATVAGPVFLLSTLAGGMILLAAAAFIAAPFVARHLGWPHLHEMLLGDAAAGAIADVQRCWQRVRARRIRRHAPRHGWSLLQLGLEEIGSREDEQRRLGERHLEQAMRVGYGAAGWRLGRYREEEKSPPDLAGAEEAYRLGMEKGDAMAAHSLGRLYEREIEPAKATEAYAKGIDLGDGLSAHSLGLLLMGTDRKGAVTAFRAGIRLHDRLSHESLADIYRRDAQRLRERRCHTSARRADRVAAFFYRHAVEMGETAAAIKWGSVAEDNGDFTTARDAYQAGLQMRSAEAALRLGKLLVGDGKLAEGEAALRRASELAHYENARRLAAGVERHPVSFEAALELARLAELHHQSVAARQLYRAALGDSGSSGQGDAAMPLVRLLRNDPVPDETEIEQLLRRGVKLGSIEAAIELARVLDEAGQWPEARLILKTAVAFEGEQFWRKNKSFDAAFALGTRLEAHYEKAEAQDAFRVAVERGSVAAQTRLVRLFVRTDDSAAAEKFAVEKGWLTNLAPGLILARYLCRAGRTDAVLSLLRSLAVCAHELEDASSLEKIARIFEACGQVEDAERIYEQAAQLGSTQSAHELARLLNVKGQPERAQRALSVAEIISNDILPAKDTSGGRV